LSVESAIALKARGRAAEAAQAARLSEGLQHGAGGLEVTGESVALIHVTQDPDADARHDAWAEED
jgi:hypothetical protein